MGELALTCLDRSSKETTNGASMGDLFKKGGRASRALWQPQPGLSAAESSPGVLKFESVVFSWPGWHHPQ